MGLCTERHDWDGAPDRADPRPHGTLVKGTAASKGSGTDPIGETGPEGRDCRTSAARRPINGTSRTVGDRSRRISVPDAFARPDPFAPSLSRTAAGRLLA